MSSSIKNTELFEKKAKPVLTKDLGKIDVAEELLKKGIG